MPKCKEPDKVIFYEKYSRKDFDKFIELLQDLNQIVKKKINSY